MKLQPIRSASERKVPGFRGDIRISAEYRFAASFSLIFRKELLYLLTAFELRCSVE